MASGNGISAIESHVTGDVYTQPMWQELEDNVNNGIVTQLGCTAYKSTPQVIATNTATALTWDTEVVDTDSMHSVVTNPTRITAQTQGFYNCACTLQLSAGGTSGTLVELQLFVNGSAVGPGINMQSANAVDRITLGFPVYLNVNDYVEFMVTQDSTANRSTVGGATGTQVAVVRL